MNKSRCFSCRGMYPDIEGPTHRYMRSSPGCWAAYGVVLAREYSNPEFSEVHRLTVDAYAVQHPGGKDRQSIHSVALHLIRLCLFLEHELKGKDANDAMLRAGRNKLLFVWLEPPGTPGEITAADVFNTENNSEHKIRVKEWARSAWEAWVVHHETIRSWLPSW